MQNPPDRHWFVPGPVLLLVNVIMPVAIRPVLNCGSVFLDFYFYLGMPFSRQVNVAVVIYLAGVEPLPTLPVFFEQTSVLFPRSVAEAELLNGPNCCCSSRVLS